MKIHTWKGNGVGYPVGSDIPGAIKFAKGAAQAFNLATRGGVNNEIAINVWCRGSSGAILAALFTGHLKRTEHVRICHIKKDGEESHRTYPDYWRPVCGIKKVINIIIDDFICTGDTMRKIWEGIQKTNAETTIDYLIAGGRGYEDEDCDWTRWIGFKPGALITNK